MGHNNRNNEEKSHHQAADNLVNLFTKANHDLLVVQYRLEKEFQQIYPDNANPMKLVSRIKKIQEELSSLTEQCRELLSAKQDLIDKARTILVGNRNLLQRMQASTGTSLTSDSDDPALTNFNQIIDEWTDQVRSRIGVQAIDTSASMVLFKTLFTLLVQEIKCRNQSPRISINYFSQPLFKATEQTLISKDDDDKHNPGQDQKELTSRRHDAPRPDKKDSLSRRCDA
ncbi:spindle and kinetochore-associated protein 2 [Gossypium australe]|uniref:Protein FAM33A n=1 Tax=Gossypium australe TaxID=47621 RepID=A0A5B6UJU5_9ROSI|nr:spindle and kinetochore-associated protein 2 [Gossypium australe]